MSLEAKVAYTFLLNRFQLSRRNGWVNEWEKREWKNAKGNKVKNAEQWEQFRKVAAPHSVRVIYEKGAEDEN